MKRLLTAVVALSLFQLSFAADKKIVPDSLVGVWQGKCKIYLPLSKNPQLAGEKDTVDVTITIHKDGAVQGSVGKAKFVKCRFAKNRGWFGRWLNIKTDFIIKGGYLQGPLYPGDSVQVKKFTLPFNIINGKMRGSVMQIFRWKYPKPLVSILIAKMQTNTRTSKKKD